MSEVTKSILGIPSHAICYFSDGDQLCCVYGDFMNLQESPVGFGKTPDDALVDLQSKRADLLCDRCYGTGEDEYNPSSYCQDCEGTGFKKT